MSHIIPWDGIGYQVTKQFLKVDTCGLSDFKVSIHRGPPIVRNGLIPLLGGWPNPFEQWKNPDFLGYIGAYKLPSQKGILKGSLLSNQYNGKWEGFLWLIWNICKSNWIISPNENIWNHQPSCNSVGVSSAISVVSPVFQWSFWAQVCIHFLRNASAGRKQWTGGDKGDIDT